MNKKPHISKRVVIAGFGDTGLLTAVNLPKHLNITAISTKPLLVSGQELGTRLSNPTFWKQHYFLPFKKFKGLKQVRPVHGEITHINPKQQQVTIKLNDGALIQEDYDALLLSSGVTNSFWRNSKLQNEAELNDEIHHQHQQLKHANTIAVVGGGASGVSTASNLALYNQHAEVHFFYSQALPLPGYHPKVRCDVEKQLANQGVYLHAKHRADMSHLTQEQLGSINSGEIQWQSKQKSFQADAIIWTVGQLKPNNQFIPSHMLDSDGFVCVDEYLRVEGYKNIFSVGDIAATDIHRSSARNAGFLTAAHNITQTLAFGDNAQLKPFKASPYRWGSIMGVQYSGMRIYTPKGGKVRIPLFLVLKVLFPMIVAKFIYKGLNKS